MMTNSTYDNLDNCINFLFNVYYGKSDKCYAITPIKKKSITIDDLRKPLNYDYKNVFDGTFKFNNIFNLDGNNYVNYKRTNKENTSSNVCIGKISMNQNDMTRPELQHMAMLYMCSEIIFNEKFRGVVLPIMSFDIDTENISKYLPDAIEKLGNIKTNDKLFVVITENFFKTRTLLEYLDENISKLTTKDIKNIIFQVLHILAKLSERFNSFTHKMLTLDSLLLWINEKKEKKEYKLGTFLFELESDIDIKMTNFYNSSTSDYNTNTYKYNPYYDINYFMVHLYFYLDKHKKIDTELNMFFDEIIPSKFRPSNLKEYNNFEGLNETEFDMNSEEIITAVNIIKKNKFLKEFIKMDLSVSPKELKISSIKDFNQKGDGILYIEKNKKNKKSKEYYNSMSNYKGSRKIVVPGFNNTGLTSEYSERSNLFTGGSPASSAKSSKPSKSRNTKREEESSPAPSAVKSSPVSTVKNDSSSVSVSTKKSEPSSSSVSNKKDKEKKDDSSSSVKVTETETEKTETANEIARALKKTATKGKSSKSKHRMESSDVTESIASSEGGSRRRQSQNATVDSAVYENLRINPKHAALLKKLPSSYLDMAPEGMVHNMPAPGMESGMDAGMHGMMPGMGMPNMGMPGMGMPGMGMPNMGMPGMGMAGMGMAGMGMPNMEAGMGAQPQLGPNDYAKLNQLASYPPMPQMEGMPNMGQTQGGMPGMGQMPMMPMMGGGSLKKYKFIGNILKNGNGTDNGTDNGTNSSNFFF